MGAYLSKASTDKDTTSGSSKNGSFTFAHSSMQGWRINMEDDYTCCPNLNLLNEMGLYAVFDGHGGPEVAELVASILPEKVAECLNSEIIEATRKYSEKMKASDASDASAPIDASLDLKYIHDLASLLNKVCLEIDASLTQPEFVKKLTKIVNKNDKGSDKSSNVSEKEKEERMEELKDLLDESEMSVEDLMMKYGVEKLKKDEAGSSSSKSSEAKEGEKSTEKSTKLTTAFDNENDWQDDDDEDDTELNLDEEASESEKDSEELATKNEGDSDSKSEAEEDTLEQKSEVQENGKENGKENDKENDKENESESDREKRKKLFNQKMLQYLREDEDDDEYDKFPNDRFVSPEETTEPDSIYDDRQPGSESGTTAVIGLLTDTGLLMVANVGDSRALVGRDVSGDKSGDDQPDSLGERKYLAIDMSVDHKPEDEIEFKRIKNAGGSISVDGRVDGGLNLSRCLGDHYYKQTFNLPLSQQKISCQPDIRFYQLTSSDKFIVLACDGIWNCMSSQKVAEFVGSRIESNQSLTKISEELLDNCVAPDTKGDGTGCDNMTAVIIKIEDTFLNKKTTPKFNEQEDCKKTDERLEIIEESNGNENSNGDTPNFTESGFGFEGSRFVDSNMSEEEKKNCNVNAGDGSSRKCGRFLSEGCYDVIDFEFNSTTKLWQPKTPDQDKENEPIATINGKTKSTTEIEESPPTKKARTAV